MKKKFIVAILFTMCCIAKAQNIDSLFKKANELIRSNIDSSYLYFQQALDLCVDEAQKLTFYNSYATELFYSGELEMLRSIYAAGLTLDFSTQSYPDYAKLLKLRTDYHKVREEYDSALTAADQSFEIAGLHQDTLSQVGALVDKGSIFETIAEYSRALDFYLEALTLAETAQNKKAVATAYISLAVFYSSIENPDLSISYNKKALELYDELNEAIKVVQIYNNLGLALDKKGSYDSAKYYLEKGFTIAENIGSEFGKAITELNLGLNSYRIKDYQKSLDQFNRVYVFFSKVNDGYGMCLCNYNYCRIYRALGQKNKAVEYGLAALKIAEERQLTNELEGITEELSELYEERGDMSNALKYFKMYSLAKDSLVSTNKNQEIGRLESKFDLNKSLYENQLLGKEIDLKSQTIITQRATIAGSIVGVLLLLVIAIILRKQLRERKILMSKIEGQAKKLQELDQAKSRFFSNISHDLRSPLTLILGALDKINERDYEILDSESKELLDVGYKNGKRLLYLADEIMDLTRLEEGKIILDFQYVKIVPYLRLLTKMFSSAADIKMIELKFSTEADEETILHIDPHQFEKIIYNLLSNAIKFTPEGGTVDIELQTEKENLKIRVVDTGSGIPNESKAHVFDRYYQSGTNDVASQAGVGIGLALVKELVELHKGSIEVESSSSGTAFTITIPFKESNWVSQAIIPERSLDVVTRNSLWVDLQEEKEKHQVSTLTNLDENAPTILIVEDHRELRSYLKSILSTDYRIYLATNGTDALDVLQTEKIDLIVSDLMMPYMDGFELIEQLKRDKELKKIPVLIVSARTDKTEKLDLISKGAIDVIGKPFDKEELYVRIKSILTNEWDSNKKLSTLYGETAEEFEKNVMARLERLIIKRVQDQHLSVLDLADEMAASERKVYRMIKKISGLTPYELIKEVRWQFLENHLKNNKVRTATEAAQLIGMNNVSSFSSQYQKRFGHSVREMVDS